LEVTEFITHSFEMKKLFICLIFYSIMLGVQAEDWNQFRGPTGQGHSVAKGLPLTWNRTSGVAWQVNLDGKAWSSPISINNQIILTNALLVEGHLSLEVLSIEFGSGKINWRKVLFEYDNQPRIHKKNSYASPTPFFDGSRIFVHFGNLGTACLEINGDLIWKKKFDYLAVHGGGGSPVIYKDLLLFSADGEKDPCLYALNKKTGEIRWKARRDSNAKKNFSFCTPIIINPKDNPLIISPASDYVFAYNLDGKQVWKFNYPNGYSVVPRPVFDQGMIYFSSGYDSPIFYSIKTGGYGDVTKTHLAWKTRKGAPRNSSVVIVNNLLFMAADNGVVSCLNSRTGLPLWVERVAGSCSSSLVYADGTIYLADETGKTFIFEAKPKYKLLGTNELEERMLASPIVVNNSLILRTEKSLWRIDP